MSKGSKRRPGTITDEQWARTFGSGADDPADARYELYPLDDAEQEQRVRAAYAASEERQADGINRDIATAEPAVSSDPGGSRTRDLRIKSPLL